MTIAVVAVVKVPTGKRDELLKEFAKVVQYVKDNEPDTYAYQATTNPNDPDSLVVIERYKDHAALKQHGGSEEFKKFGALLKERDLGSIASIDVYDEVESVGFTSRA